MSKAIYSTNKNIDDDLLLGYLFFYNLGDIKIDENDLEDVFRNNGLSTSFVRKISKVDAFRRATTKAKQTVDINYKCETTKAKIEVDEVKSDKDQIVRLLGRKLVDEKNEKLSYQAVGKIIYDRGTESIKSELDYAYASEYSYSALLYDTEIRFADWSKYHTRDTVRNITNQVLKGMHPVNLLPTGIAKFIPKVSKDTLYSLKGVIEDLSDYGTDSLFEVIPVIDTDEQRGIVNNAAEREVKDELHNLTLELREVLTQRQSIPSRTAASYISRFKTLKEKVAEYESLLGTYMGAINTQIQKTLTIVEDNKDVA